MNKNKKANYKIFISHCKDDSKIAEKILELINNAFEGKINCYLAKKEILSGDDWKREIIQNLRSSDALISLITSNSINKPWIYIEWSPFWIKGKTIHMLLSNRDLRDRLINPMQDRQITSITITEDVNKFFKKLSIDSGKSVIPYNLVDSFIHEMKLIINDNHGELLLHDLMMLYNEDKKLFFEKTEKIYSEKETLELIGFLLNQKDTKTCQVLISKITHTTNFVKILNMVIENNLEKSSFTKDIIHEISIRNQTHLRGKASFLIRNGKSEDSFFNNVVDGITNSAELIKLLPLMIDFSLEKTNNFTYIVDILRKKPYYSKKVLSLLIEHDLDKLPIFKELLNEN